MLLSLGEKDNMKQIELQLKNGEHLSFDANSQNASHSNLQEEFNEKGRRNTAFFNNEKVELPKNKETLLLEEAREIRRRVNNGEQLYNLTLTIEQLEMLKENQEKK